MASKNPHHVGRYEIVERLGEGGMGIVYLARDPSLGRTVAIKVLAAHSGELHERFMREARSAAALTHPNIITLFDVGEDAGRPFIAMEYLDGPTLAEAIHALDPLPLERKLELMLELCSGLGHAHRAGIIHRDIKPANLMITSQGVLKILDFGLARWSAEASMAGLTLAGMIIGTPSYMSPEQIEGGPLDHRSDIFAVGLVLYELLSAEKAFGGETPHHVSHKILNLEPRPLQELCVGLDPDLERIVVKAIQKSPDRRYQKLSLMAEALTRVLERTRPEASADTPGSGRARTTATLQSQDSPAHSPTPRHLPSQAAIERRRTEQVDACLSQASKLFAAGDFAATIEQCEMAMVLDPNDSRVLALLQRAHKELEDRQVHGWLADAENHLARNETSAAGTLIAQALQLRPESPDGQRLRRLVTDRRQEQERLAARARAAQSAINRARANLEDGAVDAALLAASEALAHEPDSAEAHEIKERATEAIRERRRQEELEHKVLDAVAAARRLAAHGELESAIRQLRSFGFQHPLVNEATDEFIAEKDALERAQTEARRAEDARRASEAQQAEEARRVEEARPPDQQEQSAFELNATVLRRQDLSSHTAREAPVPPGEPDRAEAPSGESWPVPTPTRNARSWRRGATLAAAFAVVAIVVALGVARARKPAGEIGTPAQPAPAPAPASSAPTTASAVSPTGTVMLDALPWAEVVRIVDGQGRDQALPSERHTPMLLVLPAGDYEISLRHGVTRTLRVRVEPSTRTASEIVDFGQVTADDYFRRLGWR